MNNIKDYLPEIRENLKKLDPYKIILFGSIPKEEENENSDIDLLVILDSEKISKNYEEKMQNKLLVRKSIYELSKKIPIDILVYTKKEFEIIENNRNSFFKDVDKTGTILYEKTG